MAAISNLVAQIRSSAYGADVREAIASALEQINSELVTSDLYSLTLEVHDIRVGTDNKTYTNAGTSVRSQINAINEALEEQVRNLTDRLTQFRKTDTNLTTAIDDVNSELNGLINRITSAENKIRDNTILANDLDQDIGSVNGVINGLKARINKLESAIGENSDTSGSGGGSSVSDLASIQQQVTRLAARLSLQETQCLADYTELLSKINSIVAELSSGDYSIVYLRDDYNTFLQDYTTRMNKAEADIAELQRELHSVELRVTVLEVRLAQLTEISGKSVVDINILTNSLNRTAARVGNMESQFTNDIAALYTSVEDLEEYTREIPEDTKYQIDNLQAILDDHEERIAYVEEHGGSGEGGGGGGGTASDYKFTAVATVPWPSTISKDAECPFSFRWSSTENGLETGPGQLLISVNGKNGNAVIMQGDVTIDINTFGQNGDEHNLNVGDNQVTLTVTDSIGKTKTFRPRIKVVELALSSNIDTTQKYTDQFSLNLMPTGAAKKYLTVTIDKGLDGEQVITMETSANGRYVSVAIPKLSHGSHTIDAIFSAQINGTTVYSNELHYEIMFVDEMSTEKIITSSFNKTELKQYTTANIDWSVVDPRALQTRMVITVNDVVEFDAVVGQEPHSFNRRFDEPGEYDVVFTAGTTTKSFHITVAPSDYNIAAETNGLVYHFSPVGRSNNDANLEEFVSAEGITTRIHNLNKVNDGILIDNNGNTVLRLMNGSWMEIDLKPFETNFVTSGATFEFEYRTFQGLKPNAIVMSSADYVDVNPFSEVDLSEYTSGAPADYGWYEYDGERYSLTTDQELAANKTYYYLRETSPFDQGWFELDEGEYVRSTDQTVNLNKRYFRARGFVFTPDWAYIGSEQANLMSTFKDDNVMRTSFTIEPRSDNRMFYLYNDAKITRGNQYPANDNWAQLTPTTIKIGSPDCAIDILSIRVYRNYLNPRQMEGNWIADCQNVDEMIERFVANDIFDDTGKIDNEKISGNIGILTVHSAYLPETKQEDGAPFEAEYVLRSNPARNFIISGEIIKVQGTSSAAYVIKNFKIKIKKGFLLNNGEKVSIYTLVDNLHGVKVICLKADVASSEGANNTVQAMTYDDGLPANAKTPALAADSSLRVGIYGIPIIMFWNNTTTGETNFYGKMNMNVDKGDTDVFGYDENTQCWEFKDNNTDLCNFLTDDFTDWKSSFEARYPDPYEDVSVMQPFWSFIVNSTLPSECNTAEEKAAAISAFKTGFEQIANKYSFQYYFLEAERYKSVDGLAKNFFIQFVKIEDKWIAYAVDYDRDTINGSNNEGVLNIPYSARFQTQIRPGAYAFNGYRSRLWKFISECYSDELASMHHNAFNVNSVFGYNNYIRRFENHQVWPAAIYNEDEFQKHINPFIKDGRTIYLPMIRGDLKYQRRDFVAKAVANDDSWYKDGVAVVNQTQWRSYGKASVAVTSYIDQLVTVRFGSSHDVSVFCNAGDTVVLDPPADWSASGNDSETYLLNANWVTGTLDIHELYPGTFDGSTLTRLEYLILGSNTSGYSNSNLVEVHLNNMTSLKGVRIQNSPNLTSPIDMSDCLSLKEAYFEGSSITGVKVQNGGIIEVLHLPNTVANVELLNLSHLRDFTIGGTGTQYSHITTLHVENVDESVVPTLDIIRGMPNGARILLRGVRWNMASLEDVETLYAKLDQLNGMNAAGDQVATSQAVEGVIHVPHCTSLEEYELRQRYPYLDIIADTYEYAAYFYNDEDETKAPLYMVLTENGEAIEDPLVAGHIETPTKPDGDGKRYTYRGWDTELVGIEGNIRIHAVYDSANIYDVKFVDSDGETVLDTQVVVEGGNAEDPTQRSENPIAIPTKETDANGKYTFDGWSGGVLTNVLANLTLVAHFAVTPVYLVTYKSGYGSSPETLYQQYVASGENAPDPITSGAIETPTRPDDTHNHIQYTFSGWDKDGVNIIATTTINAQYTESEFRYAEFRTYEGNYFPDSMNTSYPVVEGQTSLAKIKIAPGSAVPDPIATGVFETPVKNYVHMMKSSSHAGGYYNADLTETQNESDDTFHYVMNSLVTNRQFFNGDTPYRVADTGDTIVITYPDNAFGAVRFRITDTEASHDDIVWLEEGSNEIRLVVPENATSLDYWRDEVDEAPLIYVIPSYRFIFKGWNKELSSAISSDEIYYAQYKSTKQYKVRYCQPDETLIVDYMVTDEDDAPYTVAEPTKASDNTYAHNFVGWNANKNGTADPNARKTIKTDLTLFAIYEQVYRNYTIRFALNSEDGGTVFNEKTDYHYGDTIVVPSGTPTSSRAHYVFDSWLNVQNTVTGDLTFYAQFVLEKYTITFVNGSDDGGNTLQTSRVEYGTMPTPPENPTSSRSGYEFSSWSPALATVTGNQTYTAVYEIEIPAISDFLNMTPTEVQSSFNAGDRVGLVDFGTNGKVYAKLAGVNLDGQGTATLVFDRLLTTKKMNEISDTTGGYDAMDLKAYVDDTLYPAITDDTLKSAIQEVTKYSSSWENGALVKDKVGTYKLFPLSSREVFGGTNYETQGPVYSDLFPDNKSRIMLNGSSATYWWLRSVNGAATFRYVGSIGTEGGNIVTTASGVVLCFVVKLKDEA